MEKVPLLEGEEIVSSVMCEPTPLFLTKKGWLAVANDHNIPTCLLYTSDAADDTP